MKIKMDLTGVDEAITNIKLFDVKTHTNIRKTVRKSGLRLGRNMRNRVPVDSGNLKKSIKTKFAKDGLGADVGPTYGKGSHAHLVEFGHVLVKNGKAIGHVPAHPFINPSVEEERPKYIKEIKDAVKGAIK